MIWADEGNDMIYAGMGREIIDGGEGYDVVNFSQLGQRLYLNFSPWASASNVSEAVLNDHYVNIESFWGTNYDDWMTGSNEANNFHGGAGNDTLIGYGGDDYLKGNSGNDQIYGVSGNNTLLGNDGNDKIFSGHDADLIDGGDGYDIAIFDQLSEGITLDLLTGHHIGQGVEGDRFVSIESYWGTIYDDTLIGGLDTDSLHGGRGNDTLIGNAGNDYLKGNRGEDVLIGGLGADTLFGGHEADIFRFENVSDSNQDSFDRILDFNAENEGDQIDISALDIADDVTDLTITQLHNSTVIEHEESGFKLELDGVQDLTNDHFIW